MDMKKYRFFLWLAVVLAALPLFARAADIGVVVVWKSDGSKMIVSLDEQPQVSFAGEDLVVQTRKSRMAWPVREVLRFTYESASSTGLGRLRPGDARVSLSGGRLRFSALKAGSPVELYGADGRQLLSAKAGADGVVTVDAGSIPAGTYIVKTSAGNFKIHKP